MPRRQPARGAVDCATFRGRDCAEVFAGAAEWLADPVQTGIQLWAVDLDQPRRVDRESDDADADVYLELFYLRSDNEARSTQEQAE
ncbi:hypothetical protein HFP15_16875 [Amycolatopsis sp. K13G38]|uniref:Uncharacterized protein n=1 Tax=Amycolatopsis acididurans TaxID=2724524 RepID=A0ABX1J859_9PSEU|nr:hypothetical protein [Amycolatopsis acididurans]NKQ54556.1 hypothetical protein [Amycolatopsis acididurans]